ncbi:MAG: lysozyme inhibitor LprI family protein [Hyphomicrobiaceae bacterium]
MVMPFRSVTAAIALAAAFSAYQTPASAASFSCMNAEEMNAAEQTICDSHRLGALDERLDSWYRRALIRAGYFEQTAQVRADQRDWLAQRDACGADDDCLRRAYRSRIRQLKDYVEHV